MADNTDKPADLRIRKLNITAPPQLKKVFLQRAIIDQGVNLKGACGEGGDGAFSWLLRFDASRTTMRTGGAPPSDDPFGVGYCFVEETVEGLSVSPVTVALTANADGSLTSEVIPKLNVPIYVQGSLDNVVILPLTNASLQGVTLSPDGNCIGRYNPIGVASPPDTGGVCADQDPSLCQRWHTAGALGGSITLEEADGVVIQELHESLCMLLTETPPNPQGRCPRDAAGNLLVHGDYCSRTGSSGGCRDSSWLAATFAASAVKINDGANEPPCNGTRTSPPAGGARGGDAGKAAGGGDGGGAL
jgi:hypothetical protein